MIGWSPGCYIPSFRGNRPAVPEKSIFEVFLPYMGHLGHVTSIMSSDFFSLYLEAFIQNLVQIRTVVSEKIQFEFLYVHDLGPRSRCLLLLPFRSLAAIVSKKFTVFTFYY